VDILIQNAINALALGGTYALLALGLALVFSIMGLINLAHGELMTIGAYALYFMILWAFPFWLALAGALLCAVAAAVLMERVAFRPVRDASMATMLLTSFAVSAILQVGYQNLISPRPLPIAMPSFLGGAVEIGGLQVGMIQALALACTAALLLLLVWVFRYTGFGVAMRAAAEDFDTTRLMGIRANALFAGAFALSGLLAGVAALFWVAQRGSVDPLMGFLPVLKAFIAVIVGGLGSLVGAVAGGFLLGAIEIALRALLPPDLLPYRDALSLLLIIMVLLVRPQGLMGQRREGVR
jgi:branched-chain amino acid transport system permease protein